jgi:hypothetical protein
MARYTVHVPPLPEDRTTALERSVFVRDGWSWGAFLFGPFWLLWHRHWVTGLFGLVLCGGVIAGLAALPVEGAVKGGIVFFLALLWGLEGSSLRRLALGRAGYAEEGLVVGHAQDALEQRFFAEASGPVATGVSPPSGVSAPATGRSIPVIGLFPDARKHP